MTRKRKLLAAGLAVAAASSISVAAVAQSDERPRNNLKSPVETVDKSLAGTYAILERPRTAEDNLPGAVAEEYIQRQPNGVNGSLARKAFSTSSTDVFVVPADGQVCIITTPRDGTSFSTCTLAESLRSETNVPSTNVESEKVTIFGMVPDGVEHVTVTFDDGSKAEHPVTGNVYLVEATVSNQAVSVTYDGPTGRVDLDTIRHDPERFKNLREMETGS